MSYNREEIERTLIERPELAAFFKVILEAPESQRGGLVSKAKWILEELAAGKSHNAIAEELGIQL